MGWIVNFRKLMLIAILIFDVVLVAWSLHLMQEALRHQRVLSNACWHAGSDVSGCHVSCLFSEGSYVGYPYPNGPIAKFVLLNQLELL
jgi:hypothetical protein